MIRFAWRQFRVQAAVAVGALLVIAVVLAITGPYLVSVYDASVATCRANRGSSATCMNGVANTYHFLQGALDALVLVVPALIGIFWGAPLVAREFEAGTFRLAWTQSVTRSRWLATKFGVIGLSSMAIAGLLSLMITWWNSPVDSVNANRFSPATFALRGLVPIGYAAFALAFGVTAGLLIRRTLPAMVATLVGFVFVRIGTTYWVRPHLFAPMHEASAITSSSVVGYGSTGTIFFGSGPSTVQLAAPNIPNAWIYSTQIVDGAGHVAGPQLVSSICPFLGHGGPGGRGGGAGHTEAPASAVQGLQECGARLGTKFHELLTYQPASRYWAFQWSELAIFLAVALIVFCYCVWRVRRRPA